MEIFLKVNLKEWVYETIDKVQQGLEWKKLFILLLVMFIFNISNAQDVMDTYSVTYSSSPYPKSYKLSVGESILGQVILAIEVYNDDTMCGQANLNLTPRKREKLRKALKKSIVKYEEWKDIAIKNDVKDFAKEITRMGGTSTFAYGNQLHVGGKPIIIYFQVSKGIQFISVTTRLIAIDNEYMNSGLGIIIFYSINEINSFLEKISEDKIQTFYNEIKKKNELFNNYN